MEIKFDAGKRLYTNAIRHRIVQGENLAESITITGPKQVGALDLSQLRMAVRVNSTTYETTVEKTLSQTVQGENISLEWVVDKMFTAVPGPVSVTLVGYGNEEEVIKITSDGILVKADDVNGTAPPESTWEQLLAEMQQFATETYQNAQAAAASEANAKDSETAAAASAQDAQASKTAAAASAEEAKNAADTAAQEAAEQAAAQAAAQTEAQIRSYADDRYARALKATDGPAEQLTIYPDEGSSLQITVHGDTVQEGEGDTSHSNVRPITGVGRKVYRYVVTGQEAWFATASASKYRAFLNGTDLPVLPKSVSLPSVQGEVFCTLYPVKTADETFNDNLGISLSTNGSICVFDPNYATSDITPWKQHLQDLYAAGTPFVIYYVPVDENQATGWYTWEAVDGAEYAAVGLPLNNQLYDGDTVSNDEPSGFDKTVVFDGSKDEKWTAVSGKTGVFYSATDLTADYNGAGQGGNTVGPYASSYLAAGQPGQVYAGSKDGEFYIGETDHRVCVCMKNVGTVEDLESRLASAPLFVAYKSTAYKQSQKARVQIETHSKLDLVFDGGDDKTLSVNTKWTEAGNMFVVYYIPPHNLISGSADRTKCDRLTQTYGLGTAEVTEGWTVYTGSVYLSIAKSRLVEQTVDGLKAWLKQNPVHLVTPWATPIIYAHPAQPLIATPDAEGEITVTGEGKVSATYNKSITRAIAELQAAALAMGANLSI